MKLHLPKIIAAVVWLGAGSGTAQTNAPMPEKTLRIVLVGDSTVNDAGGWGYGFKQFLRGGAECFNTAANGRSSKSFIAEGRWAKALALKGDYYLIQFGHNDEPGKGPERETDPATTYRENLARYVAEARAIGARPVLVTSLTRRNFDPAAPSKLKPNLEPYAAAMKQVAVEKGVPLVDLHARSVEYCEKIGPTETAKLNPVKEGKPDTTHLNAAGRLVFARIVVAELRTVAPELAPYLRAEPVPVTDTDTAAETKDPGLEILAPSAAPAASPALPMIPNRVFRVADFGAVGDGVATNTTALQSAINAASAAGGGVVEVPAGVFLCGPIKLASQVNLRLTDGALLRMLPLGKYPGGTINPENFISGTGLHDVAITGAGAIDGQGAAWWPLAKTSKTAKRPRMITPANCERVLIEGVTLSNSPMFHIAIGGKSADVTVRGVTIRAPASDDPLGPSHNTDACDVKGRNILIANCDVSVGDDNFTCGGDTSDVLITNCTYGFGHGVSIGSPTHGGVSNITVINCTFHDTETGIRIKSDRDRGGLVQDLKYLNLRMTNVGCPILIYASYMAQEKAYRNLNNLTPETAAKYPAAPIGERTPVYRDFVFSNITATAASGRRAGLIWGLPEMNVTNVLLENVTITADKPFGVFGAQGVRLVNAKIVTPEGLNRIVSTNAPFDLR